MGFESKKSAGESGNGNHFIISRILRVPIKNPERIPFRQNEVAWSRRGLWSRICRKKEDDKILLCHDCDLMSDETLRFFDVGPHVKVYGIN